MDGVNIFNQVHKGLRAALYDTAINLQRTDFTCGYEADEAIENVNEVVMLFEEHAQKEDHFILPLIAAYEPSVTDAFEQEHFTDLLLSAQLQRSMQQFLLLMKAEDRAEAGKKINIDFVAYTVFNLQHMAKEETVLNELLWRYYSNDYLQTVQQKIVKETSPLQVEYFMKWMLRGINNTEAAAWLKEVERTAPPMVFQTFYMKAEDELPEARLKKIIESLSEGAMIV